jgi:hypothetical protein
MSDSTDALLEQRGQHYGDYRTTATVAQAIKTALQSGPSWETLHPAERESMERIATKMARAVCGRPLRDNYTDMAGYARLAERLLT